MFSNFTNTATASRPLDMECLQEAMRAMEAVAPTHPEIIVMTDGVYRRLQDYRTADNTPYLDGIPFEVYPSYFDACFRAWKLKQDGKRVMLVTE